jgi:hypothetical protein
LFNPSEIVFFAFLGSNFSFSSLRWVKGAKFSVFLSFCLFSFISIFFPGLPIGNVRAESSGD